MTSTTKEIVWLRWLLADIGIFFYHPTPMYCDNQSSIQIAHNSVFHERTKHIEIDYHLTRHHLKHGTIALPFVPSSLQIADFFTKAHSISRFCFLVGKLSMLVAAASWVWREMLNNIYIVLFIKGRIVLSVWPIYILFVFRLRLSIHNIQIIQNSSLLSFFDLN